MNNFNFTGEQMIHITEAAAKQFTKLNGNSDNVGFRLSLVQSGCNGYSYSIQPAITSTDRDDMFQAFEMIQLGIALVVDFSEMAKLDGMTIDYVKSGFNENFTFDNPNASGNCGCGSSVNF